MSIRIARDVLRSIERQLEGAYPYEGCGLLVGVPDGTASVRQHLPVPNRREKPAARHRFLISPEDFRLAERRAARQGLQIVGTYHSHPDVAAVPSAYDRDHAWPWFQYLILSVVDGKVRDARAWRLRDDRSGFQECMIHVEEDG